MPSADRDRTLFIVMDLQYRTLLRVQVPSQVPVCQYDCLRAL